MKSEESVWENLQQELVKWALFKFAASRGFRDWTDYLIASEETELGHVANLIEKAVGISVALSLSRAREEFLKEVDKRIRVLEKELAVDGVDCFCEACEKKAAIVLELYDLKYWLEGKK